MDSKVITSILYCDMKNISCDSSTIENAISKYADSFIHPNEDIWFFKYAKEFKGIYISIEEAIMNDLEPFAGEKSIIFISACDDRHCDGWFPDCVEKYL